MEVRKIGQGGQSGFDNMMGDTSKAPPIQVTSIVKVEVVKKSQEKDSTNLDGQSQDSYVNKKELQKALDKLTGFLTDDNTSVEYQYHSTFKNDLMITIVDKSTKQVLLEVPPKRILDLVAKMMEMVGVLFDKKA